MSKEKKSIAEDPNTWWFWIEGSRPFEVKYAPNWQAKAMGYVGPFPFRIQAERERVDRLITELSPRLVNGSRKEAP